MRLELNAGLRNERVMTCSNCGEFKKVFGWVDTDGASFAPYFAELHRDAGRAEVWIDVILGSWGVSATTPTDHVTFACRLGDVARQSNPAATLVKPVGNHPIQGAVLSRGQALVDPRLPLFWEIVDFILVTDEQVKAHLNS